jgi:hypothetical protein
LSLMLIRSKIFKKTCTGVCMCVHHYSCSITLKRTLKNNEKRVFPISNSRESHAKNGVKPVSIFCAKGFAWHAVRIHSSAHSKTCLFRQASLDLCVKYLPLAWIAVRIHAAVRRAAEVARAVQGQRILRPCVPLQWYALM